MSSDEESFKCFFTEMFSLATYLIFKDVVVVNLLIWLLDTGNSFKRIGTLAVVMPMLGLERRFLSFFHMLKHLMCFTL